MIGYVIGYLASFLLARWGHDWLSGLILLAVAVWLYVSDWRRTHNLIHLRGIFSLFWVGGEGLACLKLSRLQTDWATMTWICFFLAYAGFWAVFELLSRIYGEGSNGYGRWRSFEADSVSVFRMICVVTLFAFAAFLTEAFALGYVPLLVRGVPHAYSEFHLTGVHYVTVSSVLVPSLTVLYFHTSRGRGGEGRLLLAVLLTVVSLLIPILCVSRYQFVFAVALAGITYISLQKSFHPAFLLGLLVVVIPVYLLLTVARSHDVEYLNGIFEMKQEGIPIFLSQPYIYIANNYDNFNCLVEALDSHSLGLKGLLPLWTFTGLKFFFPQLINFPVYVDKAELTTLTMFYDAYYDFGWIGVLLFSAALGLVSYLLVIKLREMRNPMGYLLHAQIAVYLMLSFFTTWFSNTTTWFYLIVTAILAVYYSMSARRR